MHSQDLQPIPPPSCLSLDSEGVTWYPKANHFLMLGNQLDDGSQIHKGMVGHHHFHPCTKWLAFGFQAVVLHEIFVTSKATGFMLDVLIFCHHCHLQ